MSLKSIAACGLILVSLPSAAVLAADPGLVARCAECHGEDGMGHGRPLIPVIAGMPAGHIEEAVYAYIDNARRCAHEPKMCETVSALTEDEVTTIAEHFAAIPRAGSAEPFDANLAEQGASLYTQHCSICHLRPDDQRVEFGLGIPLHGQRKDYLRYALSSYFNGNREALLEAMAHELRELTEGDVDALIEYFASYRPASD